MMAEVSSVYKTLSIEQGNVVSIMFLHFLHIHIEECIVIFRNDKFDCFVIKNVRILYNCLFIYSGVVAT